MYSCIFRQDVRSLEDIGDIAKSPHRRKKRKKDSATQVISHAESRNNNVSLQASGTRRSRSTMQKDCTSENSMQFGFNAHTCMIIMSLFSG